ncbi:MAG TPA: hypothetical protein VMB18_17680 [Terriglobales bacterium]|nr:hypothetical protein [Terriglobales bacterium]
MPEETSPAPPAVPPEASQPKTDFNIGEEFGTAKKNLPPVKILLIGVALIVVAWGIAGLLQRPKTSATGSIDQVVSVEVPNQNLVLVAINVTVQNHGLKSFWIHTIKADVDTPTGSFSSDAANAVDFERYYQAFPTLKQYAIAPLLPEAKVSPGGQLSGTVVIGFPLTADAFAGRKSLRVSIQPYDQPVPLVLTK